MTSFMLCRHTFYVVILYMSLFFWYRHTTCFHPLSFSKRIKFFDVRSKAFNSILLVTNSNMVSSALGFSCFLQGTNKAGSNWFTIKNILIFHQELDAHCKKFAVKIGLLYSYDKPLQLISGAFLLLENE